MMPRLSFLEGMSQASRFPSSFCSVILAKSFPFSGIRFSCTEWGIPPPSGQTFLQKERDDFTDIHGASSVLDRLLLCISVPCHRPASLPPFLPSCNSSFLPSSFPLSSRRVSRFFFLFCLLCLCQDPLLPPPRREFCLSFVPFCVHSQASCKYIRGAVGEQRLSAYEIKRRIMSPAPESSRSVIHPASPLANHRHLNKSQKALFSSIR